MTLQMHTASRGCVSLTLKCWFFNKADLKSTDQLWYCCLVLLWVLFSFSILSIRPAVLLHVESPLSVLCRACTSHDLRVTVSLSQYPLCLPWQGMLNHLSYSFPLFCFSYILVCLSVYLLLLLFCFSWCVFHHILVCLFTFYCYYSASANLFFIIYWCVCLPFIITVLLQLICFSSYIGMFVYLLSLLFCFS